MFSFALAQLGCNAADSHYFYWSNPSLPQYSFSFTEIELDEGRTLEDLGPNDFVNPRQNSYSVADSPGVFYRSLRMDEGTRITLVVFPPDQEGLVIARSDGSGDAGIFYNDQTRTTRMQMYWNLSINWQSMAARYGYGEYYVGWYWNSDTKPAAYHTFELTP